MSEVKSEDKTYLYAVLIMGLFAYAPYEIFWWFNTPGPYLVFSATILFIGLFLYLVFSKKTNNFMLLSPLGLVLFYFGISCVQKFISWKTNAGFEITDISMLMVFIFPFIAGKQIEKIRNEGVGNTTIFNFFNLEFKYLMSIIGIWILYYTYLFIMISL